MTNRLMALVAYVILCCFLGILIWHVNRWDLGIVVVATALFAGYDLIVSSGKKSKK